MRHRMIAPVLDALSYRIPLPVTQIVIYHSGAGYPCCPRCACSMDREYQHFCDRCGQMLNWALLPHAEKIPIPRRPPRDKA